MMSGRRKNQISNKVRPRNSDLNIAPRNGDLSIAPRSGGLSMRRVAAGEFSQAFQRLEGNGAVIASLTRRQRIMLIGAGIEMPA